MVHAESYYPYQKDISLRLADAKDPEGSLTGSVMLKAEPDGVCEYADDFEVAALAEANDSLPRSVCPPFPPSTPSLRCVSGLPRRWKEVSNAFKCFGTLAGGGTLGLHRGRPRLRPPHRTTKARPKYTVFPSFWQIFAE